MNRVCDSWTEYVTHVHRIKYSMLLLAIESSKDTWSSIVCNNLDYRIKYSMQLMTNETSKDTW